MTTPLWQDNLQAAAYQFPDGTRMEFQYEDVERERNKKTNGFTFGDADGTYVQDRGVTGRRFPMALFFSGNFHDQDSDRFERLLGNQRGIGVLEHPRWGNFHVVPYGKIAQVDRLKTASNQTVLTVEFWETNLTLFPSRKRVGRKEVDQGIEAFDAQASIAFGDLMAITDAVEAQSLIEQVTSRVAELKAGFDKVMGTVKEVQGRVDAVRRRVAKISSSITNAIQTLVQAPVTMAAQMIELIKTPARLALSMQAIFSGIGGQLEDLFSKDTWSIGLDNQSKNEFHYNDLIASASVVTMCVASMNAEFLNKSEALEATSGLFDAFEAWTAWREDAQTQLGVIESFGVYDAVRNVLDKTVVNLVDASFDLKTERRITLTRAWDPAELCAHLYGSVSEEDLNFLITSNDLAGTEILEIPLGREIVSYV